MRGQIPFRGVVGRLAQFDRAVSMSGSAREPASTAPAAGRAKRFAAGRNIESQSEPGVAAILEGRVALYIASRSYREIFIGEYGPGDTIYLPGLDDDEDFSVRYLVIQNMRAIVSSEQEMMLSSNDNEVALDMLRLASRNFKRSCFRVMHKLAFMPVAQRLYCELLRRDSVSGDDGKFVLPAHQILAQQLVTTRETISREIAFLRRQNVIEIFGNFANVVDRGFLMRKVRVALDLETEGDVGAYIG